MAVRKNGKAYDSGDVTVEMLSNLADVLDIEYNTEQDHQLNYSLGSNKPTSWSRGKETPSGSMTLSMEDSVRLEASAKKAGLQDVLGIAPFDISVSYLNEFNTTVIDVVTAKFMTTGRKVSNGDMRLSYQYNLFVLGINLSKQQL